jgi:alkylhydroperoxidase/carboxymuconolactone decarboxylase family protein YurZ
MSDSYMDKNVERSSVSPSMFDRENVTQLNPDMKSLYAFCGDMWDASGAPFLEALFEATGLDFTTRELILIAALAIKGYEPGMIFHAQVALNSGVPPEKIRGAILATLPIGGVATAARGLSWFDAHVAAESLDGQSQRSQTRSDVPATEAGGEPAAKPETGLR